MFFFSFQKEFKKYIWEAAVGIIKDNGSVDIVVLGPNKAVCVSFWHLLYCICALYHLYLYVPLDEEFDKLWLLQFMQGSQGKNWFYIFKWVEKNI